VSDRIDVGSQWDDASDAEHRFFVVSFGIRPKNEGARLDEAEVLRIGHEFFRTLFSEFVRTGGKVHLHTPEPFDAICHLPRPVTHEQL
jgi:hypothetical protein